MIYNNSHCPCCMVSNPSPFSAALKILGILPYSLLLMNLIFFFFLFSESVKCVTQPDQMKANQLAAEWHSKSTESQESEPPRLCYIRAERAARCLSENLLALLNDITEGLNIPSAPFVCPVLQCSLNRLDSGLVVFHINKSVLLQHIKLNHFTIYSSMTHNIQIKQLHYFFDK